MYYRALFAFHLVYFVVYSTTTFLPRYFGELGMTDGQIGMLMSLPAIAGVLIQPFWGTLTDRVRIKKHVLIGLLCGLAAVCFILNSLTTFGALMIGMSIFYILQLPVTPIFATISLEYTREIHKGYGPIRLMGTLGYQAGALVVGAILVTSLRGLYAMIGVVMVLSCAVACVLPPVQGHQHGRQKISMAALMRDKHIVALLVLVFIGAITSQFYMSFFSKYAGDLGISNAMTGVILVVSVAMELPFLIFGDRLARKTSIWNWMLLGFLLNAVRWIGLAVSRNVWLILLFQLPGVSVMACFEFFPALYINRSARDELKGSAQTALTIVTFGVAKVVGSLAGGFVSDLVGIPMVFGFNGILLIAAAIVFYRPTRRLIATEAEKITAL